jgi:hypothetical protein
VRAAAQVLKTKTVTYVVVLFAALAVVLAPELAVLPDPAAEDAELAEEALPDPVIVN